MVSSTYLVLVCPMSFMSAVVTNLLSRKDHGRRSDFQVCSIPSWSVVSGDFSRGTLFEGLLYRQCWEVG